MSNQSIYQRSPRSHLFRTTLAFLTFLSFLLVGGHAAHAADVTLAWDANTDPVAGYRLYYGHASRSYQNSVDVGNVTMYTWSGLAEGRTYYFAVTAYNSSNVESAYSAELVCHTITASSGSGGSISPTGTVFVTAGQSQTFTPSPADGYNVADLAVDGVSQGALASYTFSNVTAPHTISASFTAQAPPVTYTIMAGVSGPGGTISPSGAQTVSHGGSLSFSITPGTGYHVADVVVDGVSKGALTSYAFNNVTAPHTITAGFKASNEPPVADAGPDQTVDEGALVTLLGSNSRDPEGSALSYLWEQIDGPAVQLSSTTAAEPNFRAPDVGPEGLALTFRLTVTDDLGAQSSDTCIVNVTWVNIPPTAYAGPDQAVDTGSIVTLDGSGSTDVDDGIASYSWKRVSGPVVQVLDWTQPTITFVAPDVASEEASLVFELTVTDYNGLKATDSCIVNVSWVNKPPRANAGPDQAAYETDTVTLDGSASTDDETIVSYQWKQTLGTPVVLSNPNGPATQFTAPSISAASETLTFTLTVTDAGTLQSEDTCQVTVHKKSGADLTGGWIKSSYDGSKFAGTVRVMNAGNLNAGTYKVAFYLSSNGMELTKLLKTTTVYGLSAGGSKDLSLSIRSRGLSGQFMIAVIDSTGVIQETNEANNRAVVAIK